MTRKTPKTAGAFFLLLVLFLGYSFLQALSDSLHCPPSLLEALSYNLAGLLGSSLDLALFLILFFSHNGRRTIGTTSIYELAAPYPARFSPRLLSRWPEWAEVRPAGILVMRTLTDWWGRPNLNRSLRLPKPEGWTKLPHGPVWCGRITSEELLTVSALSKRE